jgi:hypothetical protein
VPQLQRVAEQHQAFELGEPRHQRRPLGLPAQHVGPAIRAEVEV